nr:AF211538_1 Avr9/Cf-9 rapidly elicited protein 180 [Ipomoea batatas]GMD09208.1 AF211538_1 Avr9/Cf-9 rapidly elicited protein 180 [Ipomoea batatas]GMD11601.1 AF211538_1 Avr9/Cf-9 rapidly elicited protein 180 [Ipomoea batatas]GMD75836.1 AF211538_1 Avr9/Cf-9 rapidly elicited protein 180 [Ipomoea batatas]
MLKAPGYLFAFNRPNKKASGGVSDDAGGAMSGKSGGATNNSRLRRWRLKRRISPWLRWKRLFNLHVWFVDSVLFKIVSVFEAVVLISTLAFFYLFCGCHI